MVQRKVLIKLGFQAEHVARDKSLKNLKLSSQNQHGKNKGSDRKKKMKKSRPIKLSDVEALQSPPLLHVPTTAALLQKQKPFVGRNDSSPNYMRPTRSSDAKKELFQVSLRNAQSRKNLPEKSCKIPEKSLMRSCSLNLVRTLTKSPSFKSSRTCPRKSTPLVLCSDMNPPMRPTCSSTLKDSKFPTYLMLNPGGTESEGTSVMNVCPYRYCSLNGHHHAPLPPLKRFVSAKRRLLKHQESMKLEPLNPQRLKMSRETNDTDIKHNVLEHADDEADTGNPLLTPLAQEIGEDFFIEIYIKDKEEADDIGQFDKDLEGQDNIKFARDENGIAAEEDGVKQLSPTTTHALTKCKINLEEDFKNYICAAGNEADAKMSFYQEQNAEDADRNHPPCWFQDKIYMESCCSEVSCNGEHMENIELDVDGSDCRETDMEWEEEEQEFCSCDHEENIDSSVSTEETDSNFESFLEDSHDVPVMWSDDIHSSHHANILVEEALREANGEENTCFEEQPHGANSVLEGASESMENETQETDYLSNSINFDQSPPAEEVFQHLTNTDNDGEAENHVDDEAGCTPTKVLVEEMVENSQGRKMSETCEVDENHKEGNTSLENNDEGTSQENQTHSSDSLVESNTLVQEQELLEEDQGKVDEFQSTGCISGEYQNTSKSWQWTAKRKRPEQDDEEMRKIKPRKPNFLPLVPEPEAEKVNLKHQMMDERKNAEEWMLDFALRQAVTQLAPARKRKVALLVEAFETVMPIPKCESNMRSNSPFAHARPIQACN